jgi:hypothetical protein
MDNKLSELSKPVAWVMIDDLTDKSIVSTPAYLSKEDAEERTIGQIAPLLTATPAPAVPDSHDAFESTWADVMNGNKPARSAVEGQDYAGGAAEFAWKWWQRAAMLAQPVSQGCKLVPVDPTDEQLRAMLAVIWPATYREHLRHPDNGPVSIARAEEEIKHAKEQYAAAMLAAPEGGNDA